MEELFVRAYILREELDVIDFLADGGIRDVVQINKQGELRLDLSPLAV